jgi:tetratricopeptide (TPR) repeat protein
VRSGGEETVAFAATGTLHARGGYARATEEPSAADPDVACSLHNLAAWYQDRGDHVRAEQLYHRVLAITESALGREHPIVASSLHNLAALYRTQGDDARAEQFCRRALSIREKALGPDHPAVAESLGNLAALCVARGRISQAVRLLARATDIEDRSTARLLVAGPEELRPVRMADLRGTTDAAVSLHVQLAPDDEDAKRLALTTVLRRKARGRECSAGAIARWRRRLAPENQARFARWRSLCAAHSALSLRGPDALPRGEFRSLLGELDEQIQDIEAELSRADAELEVELRPVTIEKVQAAIPSGAALVELFRYEPFDPEAVTASGRWGKPRYVAYVLHRGGRIDWADLGEARPIDAATDRLLAMQHGATAVADAAARELYRRVMSPVCRLLGEARGALLSRDSALNLVPFALLIDDSGQSLTDRYAFSYVASGRDLVRRAAIAMRHSDGSSESASPRKPPAFSTR